MSSTVRHQEISAFCLADQFPTLGGGMALCDLGAVLGEPRVSFAEQFQRPNIRTSLGIGKSPP